LGLGKGKGKRGFV